MRCAILVLLAGCGADDAASSDAPPSTGGCDAAAPWASAPALDLGATQETAAVAIGGRVYVIGGFHVTAGIVGAVQVFDTAACAWSRGPDLPKVVHHANVAAVDGTIYVLGSLDDPSFTASGEAFAWNPATEAAWSPRAAMPAGTERGSAVTGVVDGKVVLAGGFRGVSAVADTSVYDPALDAWSAGPALPEPRDHACGGVVGGKLYVAGGRRGSIGSTSPIVFELAGGAWTERAPMPTGRGGTACGVVAGRLIVAGGEGNPAEPSGVFPQVEAYAPAANAWTSLPEMPTPRHGLGAAAVGGRLYFPGGANKQAFGAVATHEVLTPP
ncbi:MAG: hypothetical protein KF773_17840 [Deltaproteobacteria bacterium]|nr:hypothetical protein [Deltaproteobacteria bacterium]